MKHFLFVLTFYTLSCLVSYAEDIITLIDGKSIQAIIQEVSQTEIKYKRATNPTGPLFSIDLSNIKSIRYSNGDVDEFIPVNDIIYGGIDSLYNNTLIQTYNTFSDGYLSKKPKKSSAKSGIMIFQVSPYSVLADSNLEVSISPLVSPKEKNEKRRIGESIFSPLVKLIPQYKINITNRSSNTIYIDLGNTFRIYGDGRKKSHLNETSGDRTYYYNKDFSDAAYRIYYNSETYTESTNSGTSTTLGLGGVADVLGISGKIGNLMSGTSIGVGSGNSISHTKISDRILAIPPHASIELPPYTITIDNHLFNNYDYFYAAINNSFQLNEWDVHDFSVEDTPYIEDFIITYSTTENFNHYNTVKFSLYCSQIIGTKDQIEYNWETNKIIGIHSKSIIGFCVFSKIIIISSVSRAGR